MQNVALSFSLDGSLKDDLVDNLETKTVLKEDAAWDKRYWMRISNACNQHCIFCLDIEHHDGSYSDFEEIKNKIAEVHRLGYTRLIVSGGEASIHPRFIDIIAYASSLGFRKIQTITNGRMFSYKSFSQKAMKAGLNEATFSIHGHTAKLHNMLTATPGAFEQAMKGIENLLAIGNIIISIDICVNKQNYKHVESIIKMFEPYGIYEFDLLHIIPFGASLGNKHALFYSYQEARPYLDTVFSYKKKPGYFIWTNRFPPAYCEGHEDLIQDPHKFYDEITGRADLYQQFYREGQFSCYPHHCPFCFVKKFCRKFVYFVEQIKIPENIDTISTSTLDEDLLLLLKNKNQLRNFHWNSQPDLLLQKLDETTIEQLKTISGFSLTNIDKKNFSATVDYFADKLPQAQLQLNCAEISTELLQLWREANQHTETQIKIIFDLNLQVTSFLLEQPIDFSELEFRIPTYEKGSDAKLQYQRLFEALRKIPSEIKIWNCAPCFHQGGIFDDSRRFNFDILQIEEQKPDMSLLVSDFILNDYFAKSSRCTGCDFFSNCKGMHINFIRNFGFAQFTPLTQNAEPLTA